MAARSGDGSGDATLPAEGAGDAAAVTPPVRGDDSTLPQPVSQPPAGQPLQLLPVDGSLYAQQGELARGGMGRIVVARDRRLDRIVALKLLQDRSPGPAARFEREARITAKLQHPAIVPVYEAGRFSNGEPFYAMKLVSGQPLDQTLTAAPDLAARLGSLPSVLAVADALAYAHDRRVVHRDLKPQNVLIGKFGETVVIDWGLAKDLGDSSDSSAVDEPARGPYRRRAAAGEGLTMEGEVLGTPAYMPPEQARGEDVDERADVYALGALLYHVLAGHAPYRGKTAWDVVDLVAAGPPRALTELMPEVMPDLAAIVAKAMARDPADRYPTAKELAEDLRRFQNGQLVGVHRYTAWQLLRRFVRRHLAAVMVGAAALLVLLGLASYGVLRINRERRAAVRQRDVAEVRRKEAVRTSAALLAEQGRQELLADHPSRALPYLAEAYRLGDDSRALRLMLGEAVVPADAVLQRWQLGSELALARLSPDASQVITVRRRDGLIRVLDVATGAVVTTWPSPSPSPSTSTSTSPSPSTSTSTSAVVTAQLSPDGSRVAMILDDGPGITLRDLGSGAATELTLPPTFAGDATPTHLAFSPTGRHLVAGNISHVALWQLASSKLVLVTDGQLAGRAPFSPDGSRLATAPEENGLLIWDVPTGTGLFALPDAAPPMTFSADGGVLAAQWRDPATAVAYTPDGTPAMRYPGQSGPLQAVFVAGSAVLRASNGVLEVRDRESGEARFQFPLEDTRTLELSADGRTVLARGSDRVVRLRELAHGVVVATFDLMDAERWQLAHDGTRLLQIDGQQLSVDRVLPTRVTLAEPSGGYLNPWVAAAVFSADGALVATQGATSYDAAVFDRHTGALVAHTPRGGNVVGVEFLPDGRLLSARQRALELGEARTGRLLASMEAGCSNGLCRILVSADGRRIVSSGRVFDAISAQPLATLFETTISARAITRDGSHVLYVTSDGAEVWEVATGRRSLIIPAATAADMSPDGRWLAVADDHGTTLRGGDDGKVLVTLGGERGSAYFTPDGQHLITPGAQASVWDLTGRRLVSLEGGILNLHPHAIDRASELLVAGRSDGGVKVFDLHTGKVVRVIEHASANPFVLGHVGIAEDGSAVVTVDKDDGATVVSELPREPRSPTALAALAERQVPWQLVEDHLVARTPSATLQLP